MIPSKEEFFEILEQPAKNIKIEYARVVSFADNGEPLLVFQGEQTASQKIYPRIRSYNDARIGDRVQILDGIIQGARA